MSDVLNDRPAESTRGGYQPSPRLREALRHLHADLASKPAPLPGAKAGYPAPRPARPSASPDQPRVLLYSNAPTLRLYLCACLSATYNLDEAENVERHVNRPSFANPDLLITDLVTLERTKFSLFDLRGPGSPLAGVPLLLLSQEPSTQVVYGPGIGPDAVLSIPVMPDPLRETVLALTSGA